MMNYEKTSLRQGKTRMNLHLQTERSGAGNRGPVTSEKELMIGSEAGFRDSGCLVFPDVNLSP